MNTEDLKAFVEVYEKKSISKAAQACFMSPQGLGKIIRRIEDELGVQLFIRHSNGSVPTIYGDALYEKAARIVDLLNEVHDGIRGIQPKERIALQIPVTSGLMDYLTKDFIKDFEDNYDIKLNIFQTDDFGAKSYLLGGNSAVGIMSGPIDMTRLKAKLLTSMRYVVILNENHPLVEKDKILYQDLDKRHIGIISRMNNQYHALMNTFSRLGIEPIVDLESSQMGSIKKFASDGLGIGITTELHARLTPFSNTVVRPFEKDECIWETYIVQPLNVALNRYEELFFHYALRWVKQNETRLDRP